MQVEIWKHDGTETKLVTTLRLDGHVLTATPDNEVAKRILATPIWLDELTEPLPAAANPEMWLRNLWKHWKSHYLYATKPK